MSSTKKFRFVSDLLTVGRVTPVRSADEIEREPMLYSASPEYARQHGGPITEEILDHIMAGCIADFDSVCDQDYPHLTIDTRSHMLMPGMHPAIPGWHCDHVPRFHGGQPELDKSSATQFNYTVTVGTTGGIAPTEFVSSLRAVDVEYDPERVWGSVSAHVNKQLVNIRTFLLPDGMVCRFNGQTLHRATAAKERGWRFFFRASRTKHEPNPKIRRQVQVYTSETTGW